MAQQVLDFSLPYHFRKDNWVVIQHPHRANLRVSPFNQWQVDGNGELGKFARWKVHLQTYGYIKLQNEHSGKYLRIMGDGKIDCNGGGGKFTLFKVHFLGGKPNEVKLESIQYPGLYVAVKPNRNSKTGKAGKMCVMTFWRQNFKANINKNSQSKVQQTQPVVVQQVIQPVYVPVPQPMQQTMQQPMVQPMQQPIMAPNNVVINNNNNNIVKNKFDSPYQFRMNQKVVIYGPHGGTLRLHPKNNQIADGNGGTGVLARWEVVLHHNSILQLRNAKTQKYLRIHGNGNKIDVMGLGGKFTYFRYEFVNQERNVVKLVSTVFPNKYVAIPRNKIPGVGRGGLHCPLKFFKERQEMNVFQQQQHQMIMQNNNNFNNNNNNYNTNYNNNNFNNYNSNNNNNNGNIMYHGNGGSGFDAPYYFRINNKVVIRGPHGKHLRVSPHNSTLADGLGGHGVYAQWEVLLHANNLVQLRSLKTGGYLRIYDNGNKIDVAGKGGGFTYFQYHGNGNVMKLNSTKFPNAWVGIRKNNEVAIGRGGPHCKLTFLRKSFNDMEQIEGQFASMTMN